ncbi:hypothetical protein VPH35_069680 [Triticum aestivum]
MSTVGTIRPRLVSRADYPRALIPLGGISMASPTPWEDYHASLKSRSPEGAKTLMQMEDLGKEEGDGCGPSPLPERSFDPKHRSEEVRGVASTGRRILIDGACCSLVSLETGVFFLISGVVAFLPVETTIAILTTLTWIGQGYLPYRCIQMSRWVSRGQLSPRFSGPGK